MTNRSWLMVLAIAVLVMIPIVGGAQQICQSIAGVWHCYAGCDIVDNVYNLSQDSSGNVTGSVTTSCGTYPVSGRMRSATADYSINVSGTILAVPPAVGPLLVSSLPTRITVVPDQATGRMASLTVGRFSGIRSAMVRQARPAPGWALMQQLTANGWQWWLAEMECGEAGLLRSRLTRQRLTLAGLWARRIVTITYQKTTL